MVWKEHRRILQDDFVDFWSFLDAVRTKFGEALDQGEEDALKTLKKEKV